MQAANPAAEDAAEDAAKDAAEDAAKPAAEPAAKDADRSPTPDLVTPPRAPWMTSTPDRSSGSSPALTPSPTPSPTPGSSRGSTPRSSPDSTPRSSPDSTPVLTPASTPGKGWQSPPEGLAEWALEPEAEYYLKRQREDKESSDEDEESSDEDEESSDEDEEPIPGLAEHFRGKRQRINESATEVSGPLPRPLPRKTIFDLLAKGIERGFELSAHQTWGKVTK